MEKSKSISLFLAKLKIAFPSYFKNLSNEELIQLISLYQETLGNYNEQILNKVANEIIKTKKYLPSIAEILELCESKKKEFRYEIIEKMKQNKYFKSLKDLEKVYIWLDEDIIPSWLKKDMMNYYKKMIENKERLIA